MRDGWPVVAGSLFGLALSPGTIVFYTLGVLMDPIAHATGWSRAQVSLAASIFPTTLIFAIPVLGRLVDRFGVRRVLLPSLALFGVTLIAAGRSRELWHLYVAFAAIAVLGAGANSVSYMRAVCTWYDAHRGLAIAIAQSGMGIGVAVLPFLAQRLLDVGGWRFAYTALGGLVLCASLPVVACTVRERPSGAVKPAAGRLSEPLSIDLSEGDALRTRRFWVLLFAFLLLAGAINSVALHLVPMVENASHSRSTALLAASVFGAAMLVGRIVTGILIDRYFAPYVAATLFAASSLSIACLAWGVSEPALIGAAFVVGLSAGSDGDLLSYLVSRYFGMRSFGALSGYIFSAYLAGTALFPWLVGVWFEHGNSYFQPMLMCSLAGAGSVVLTLMLGPYPRPVPRLAQSMND
ncbi:MAG: MFS transporter [Gammaproteobacteria bacterium]